MAISFVAAEGANFSGTRSPTAVLPAGIQDGDLLLFFFVTETLHDSNGTPPSDVVKVVEQDNTTGADCTLSVFWKIAASEGAGVAFTLIFSANEAGRVMVLAYRGVDQTTPMDVSAVSGNETGTAWDTTAIVPVTDNAVVVACWGTDPAANPMTFTWDGGITERIDSDTTPTGQNGLVAWLGIADKTISPAVSTSLGGDSSSSQTAAGAALALRPAAGDFPLDSAPASYSFTGAEAATVSTRVISSDAGGYGQTGFVASLVVGRSTNAETGVYVLEGLDAALVFTAAGSFTINSEPGAYTVSGVNTTTAADRFVNVASGAYVVTGSDTSFSEAVLPTFPAGDNGYIADYGRGRIIEQTLVPVP